ncbi:MULTISPECIES: dipeptide ABC transporter ATP-binding protein [unclassified Streptomyces]|uniref:dipeptide ABC transporter ATP-binding protein n=1 Tax=unclassified Streptomyces TaxID=2593676 RepID=UPI000377EF1B|nr:MULTISPECIES: ABC transporter ATP-binding protein [unclassified Streptomyces]MYQ79800.1 dipeptide ABC transporter ATP-binding protein [Streptomyces sp. SID4923]
MTKSLTAPDGRPGKSDPLLGIEGLRISYRTRAGRVDAVRGVSLTVAPGEVVALVGASGSGKSTTAHAVVGLLPPGATVTAGRVLFGATDLAAAGEPELRRHRGRDIGFVPQDPMVSLNPVRRIGPQIGEVLLIHKLVPGRREAAERAVELLAEAGLPQPDLRARQYPHELSGGMRQRALIAIALAARPKLLIADEPTSALDVTVQRALLDHVDELVARTGTAVLLITHDLGVAADRAQRVGVMSQGEIVESGTVGEVLGDPRHTVTRQLLRAAPSLGSVRERTPPVRPAAASRDLMVARGLVKEFTRGRHGRAPVRAVDSVDLTIRRGETLALVGESGSGKSTTARLLVRLADPTSGTVHFDGEDITSLRGEALRRLRRRMQIVYQSPYASLDPRLTVEDIISEPLRAYRVGDRAGRSREAAALLDRVHLPAGTLRRRPQELSGGQRQRVAIARALALRPDLVVCDEPVSALDVAVQARILELLTELQDESGLSCLFISHDLAVVRGIAHHVGVMRGGRLIESGSVAQVFAEPSHPYTRELLASVAGSRRAGAVAGG